MKETMEEAGVCPVDDEELMALAAGELPPERQVAVARHVADCRDCREQAVRARAAARSVAAEEGLVRWHRFESAFGPTRVAATGRGLARVTWAAPDDDAFVEELEERFPEAPVVPDPDGLEGVERQISDYFSGDRHTFDLPVDLEGTGEFTRRVLDATSDLDFGEVVPYGELATRIGRPRAARAVGGALGRNPVPVVVPCHRIIRSDGGLGGYGSGIDYKKRLLRVEGRGDLVKAG